MQSITSTYIESEMYEAQRWHSDPQFQAPMITLSDGARVFIGDIVTVTNVCHGKIKKFVLDVSKFLRYYSCIFMLYTFRELSMLWCLMCSVSLPTHPLPAVEKTTTSGIKEPVLSL